MLERNVQYLKGVGPKRITKLNKLNIYTIDDLINFFPLKYEDRRSVTLIKDIIVNKKLLLKVTIISQPKYFKVNKKMKITKFLAKDESGYINITFFNQKYIVEKIKINNSYYVFGKCKIDNNHYEMMNPDIEEISNRIKSGRIVPIYALTKSLTNNELIKIIVECLKQYLKDIKNVLPHSVTEKYSLMNKKDAIKYLHFPSDSKKYTMAKRTIGFEKLLVFELGLISIKSNLYDNKIGLVQKSHDLSDRLLYVLPYKLTNAQQKVIKDIRNDMADNKPMNRLVQGDVGSGKTIVAIIAMLDSISSGYQTSLMAPTEILAFQHYETVKEYIELANIQISIEFISGSTTKKKKNEILKKVKDGNVDMLIGTHALIEKNVEFKNIGLTITDEQHRFGVRQRALLSNKGNNIDVLIMTATPIPRTLALMVYGDLDISIIDEMPPNRQKIITKVIDKNSKIEAFDFIKNKVKEGRQAYIVAPLIEESETLDLDSATEVYENLKNNFFIGLSVGLIHGKMSNNDKDSTMKNFYDKKIDILVSTTVIEVGVNVPNSVVMLILNSERFGLAQLHQLRGRVGRGKYQSYCILVNENKSKTSKERMNVLAKTNNGFKIAEEDLRLRGPGDFFGSRQHGLEKYNIDKFVNDVKLINDVKDATKSIIKNNSKLDGEDYIELKKSIDKLFNKENIVFN